MLDRRHHSPYTGAMQQSRRRCPTGGWETDMVIRSSWSAILCAGTPMSGLPTRPALAGDATTVADPRTGRSTASDEDLKKESGSAAQSVGGNTSGLMLPTSTGQAAGTAAASTMPDLHDQHQQQPDRHLHAVRHGQQQRLPELMARRPLRAVSSAKAGGVPQRELNPGPAHYELARPTSRR